MTSSSLRVRAHRLLSEIKSCYCAAQDFSEKLRLAKVYGKVCAWNSIGIYRDDYFEDDLIAHYCKHADVVTRSPRKALLQIISCPRSSGGHTRLLENLLDLSPVESDVLISWPIETVDCLQNSKIDRLFHRENGFSIDEIALLAANYKTICLHIDPEDIETAVAVGIAKQAAGNRVVFVNHADHVFSFGFRSADFVAEVSSFGFALSKRARNVVSGYVGIPMGINYLRGIEPPVGGRMRLATGGSAKKFRSSNGMSFQRFVYRILSSNNSAVFLVVGVDWKSPSWLLLKIRFPRRFQAIVSLPHAQYIEIIRQADLYIDSFPMCGGTAFPEARSLGIPVTGLVTGANGYTSLDRTKFESIDDLTREIQHFIAGQPNGIDRRNQTKSVCPDFKNAHGSVEVGNRFVRLLSGEVCTPPKSLVCALDLHFYERQWMEMNRLNIETDDVIFVMKKSEGRDFAIFCMVIRSMGLIRASRFLTRAVITALLGALR